MHMLRFLSFKTLIGSLLILMILGFVPDSLYSQTTPPATTRTTTTTSSPSTHTPARPAPSPSTTRSTASSSQTPNAPESVHQVIQSEPPVLQRPSLVTQSTLLALLSLLPFIIMILTSFLKIVVVLSLLRTALGVQQAPPNQIINGVAFLLSLFIMYPTAAKMYDAAQHVINQSQLPESFTSPNSSTYVIEVAKAAAGPMKDFLKRNSSPRHQALFYRLAYRGLPEQYKASLKPDDIMVLIPSYITGQLRDAFEIGVLIYIPFFVIDLVTSNILLAMGMMMLSPVTISMPLKLFLLVMLDGWTILIEGLVKTFQ
jgi:type III secretion protein R